MNIFWFRRDLRINDNHALNLAATKGNVLPIFIFDTDILDKLDDKSDARLSFIYQQICTLHQKLNGKFLIKIGKPLEIFKQLCEEFKIEEVFTNKDYEPYALQRDLEVKSFLLSKNITFTAVKDQVIFEENEVVKADGKPYTVFTPYKNAWLKKFSSINTLAFESESIVYKTTSKQFPLIQLSDLGFKTSRITIPSFNITDEIVKNYHETRNIPHLNATTFLGTYLRFGVVSVREMVKIIQYKNETLLSELIWREFFMQILFHFPHVVQQSFKAKYDQIVWKNNEDQFEKWCTGTTGYPIVDAGMRQLNETGYMHNRVRMVTASFLVKHLLIDWRWGEAYFAKKLLDFELSANNGNWQWAAGCGCDAAPYFRVFNPYEQHKKFDPQSKYIQKWVPEFNDFTYPKPIVEHTIARNEAIAHYKKYLGE
jgi:deoxyribodipyrimidine photo-lyase